MADGTSIEICMESFNEQLDRMEVGFMEASASGFGFHEPWGFNST